MDKEGKACWKLWKWLTLRRGEGEGVTEINQDDEVEIIGVRSVCQCQWSQNKFMKSSVLQLLQ